MNLKRITGGLLLSALCFTLVAGTLQAQAIEDNWAERFPSGMTPQLEEALFDLPRGGTLDVYAVMKDRLASGVVEGLTRGVARSDRHGVVAAALRSFSERSQKRVRNYLVSRENAAARGAARVLWISNAIRFTAAADEIAAVGALPGVGYLGVIREFPVESYQDAGVAATLPFYDGFETGVFGPDWATAVTGAGRIQITTANLPIGNYHVTMDSSVSGSVGTATMTLSLDLSSVTNCYLEFMFKEFGDELDPEDGVFISEDGVTFHQALSLSGDSSYAQKTIDLDQAAASAGISLTSTFEVRFSWKDNYPIATDGFAFDEITVDVGDPPPPPPPTPEPNIDKLQAPQCWAIGIDGDGSLILNIDSGVDYTHPDLVNQIWSNPGEIPGNGIDDDANGYIDDIRGWDFASNDNDPYPSSYHGTATAGIVCGDGTGGSITGMAPDAIMAIALISDEADYWEAQQYAVLIGATTITSSYSYKWGIHDPDYHLFRQNCDMELAAGIIHANSIGNQGDQTGSYPIPFNISTPGNCPGPWIHPDQVEGGISSTLGCAGVNLDESLYTPSGQGPSAWENMLIYDSGYGHSQNPLYWDYPYGGFGGGFPGLLKPDVCTYTNVKSTELGGGYRASFGGTSAATPHLGGAMCLLVSSNLYANARKISQALQETAEDKGPVGKDTRYGAGKVQVFDAALRLLFNIEVDDTNPKVGDTIQMEASGQPGNLSALFFSYGRGSTTIPGIGTLEIAAPLKMVAIQPMPAGGHPTFPITIPAFWAGKTVYFQGIMDDNAGVTGRYLFTLVEEISVQP